jgi:quinol monooxygenase YgiN
MNTSILSFSRKGIVIILTVLFLFCQTTPKAQHADDAVARASIRDQSTLVDFAARLTRYDVKPDYQAAFRKVVSDYVRHSLLQENNVISEAYYEQDDPTVLWIIERWSSKIALAEAGKSPSFRALASLAKTALSRSASKIDVKDLEPLSKQQWRSVVRKTDDPITIILFVDAKAGTERNFKDVYHTAMPHFRGEPGVITYQLSELETHSTRSSLHVKNSGMKMPFNTT